MRQKRPFSGSMSRWAWPSVSRTLRTVRHALPVSLPGPIGTCSESTSTTVLAGPSTAMSIRTQKKCWWLGAVEPGGDERAVRRALADRDRARGEHARQLDLVLDRAVVVEVPEVPVLVVADGRDERDDEAAQAPDLDLLGAEVRVLPGDPGVLLVHADRVGHHERVAVLVVDEAVEVRDVADAVAAERQRVRQPPIPSSPWSKTFLNRCVGAGSP